MSDEGGRTTARLTLADAAGLVGGRLMHVDGSLPVEGVAPLETAGSRDLGLFASRKYRDAVAGSGAAAILVASELETLVPDGRARLVVDDPHRALHMLLERLHPFRKPPAGVHATAVVEEGATLDDDVGVGPYAVVEAGASVGRGSRIGAHCVVGRDVRLGVDCLLHPHVVLYPGTVVGDRVVLHAGARLGVDGFGWTVVDGAPKKIPHVGRCVIGNDVEIGANTTLDRGSIGDTTVDDHAKLDNLVHLAHNVRLGAGSLLAAMVGIAGSTRIGRGVLMGGQAGAINHLDIGDGVQVAAASAVLRDVPDGEVVSGNPARPNRDYLRKQAHVERLPRLIDRVKALEARLDAFDPGDASD